MPLHLLLLAAALALPGGAQAQNQAAAQPREFVFRFQPPDGVRFKVQYTQQRLRTIEGQKPTRDESESLTEGSFRRASDHVEYRPRIVMMSMRRNGAPVNDPTLNLLTKLQVTYVISAQGEATAIRGFDGVDALLKSSLSPQVAAALAPLINERVLVQREKAEWNARYAEFAGGKFRIGEVIDTEAPQALPTGETLRYAVRTSFPRWESCPAGHCVRVEQIYESDASALAQLATRVTGQIMAEAAQPAPAATASARLSGSLSRLIDPQTMLIYSEQVRRTLTMRVPLPDQGLVPMVQEEVRTYTYSYE